MPPPAEYQVKAAFVYNFIKFVDWPQNGTALPAAMRICIIGTLPDAASFESLAGEEVRGRRISVQFVQDLVDIRHCDVLFVTASQTGRLPDIIRSLDRRPTLTVGDTKGFALRGVMINMFLENKHVRFEINQTSAEAAGLMISTKLLKLARTVYSSGANGSE